jgi:rfaE bifunctional protein kinase chain/domain
MTRDLLEKLLIDIRRVRIGVVGDFCLDAYWTVDPSLSEVSIETGLETLAVSAQRYSLGGAGNVASNLTAMGVGKVCAFGVVGNDPFGREMLRLLPAAGVDSRGIFVQEHGWETPVYIKPLRDEREQGRIDLGAANSLSAESTHALLLALGESLASLDLVIVNQQLVRGIHTAELRRRLVSLISRATLPFVCDSRSFSDSYTGAIRKLNDREALRLCGEPWESSEPVPLAAALRAAETLFERWKTPVFLTRDSRGILVRDAEGTNEVPGLRYQGRIDTVGAGDSSLAGIAAALAAGREALEAATLGNIAAGVVVRKLLVTGTATAEEILAIGTNPISMPSRERAAD